MAVADRGCVVASCLLLLLLAAACKARIHKLTLNVSGLYDSYRNNMLPVYQAAFLFYFVFFFKASY